MNSRLIIVAFLFLGLALQAPKVFAQEQAEQIQVRDLKNDWIYFDEQKENYVPYVLNTSFNSNAANFFLNTSKYRAYMLHLDLQPQTTLLVNHIISEVYRKGTSLDLRIDSLYAIYHTDSLFITLFNPQFDINRLGTYLVTDNYMGELQRTSFWDQLSINKRMQNEFADFYLLGLIIVLTLVSLQKLIYPKVFRNFYDISSVFVYVQREEELTFQLQINRVSIFYLLVFSLIIGLTIVSFFSALGHIPEMIHYIELDDLWSHINTWLIMSGLVFLLILGKYLLVWLTSALIGYKNMVNQHMINYMRYTNVVYLLILVLASVVFLSDWFDVKMSIYFLLNGLVILSLFRVIILFFKFFRSGNFRTIHLIAYLCVSEIIPSMVILKVLLDN